MTTQYPTALDPFVNPQSSDLQSSATVPHAGQHANINDAMAAVQVKLGVDSSTNARTLDYYAFSASDINVKCYPFNAVGDGATDDTLALQQAFGLGLASRRRVFLPPGKYVYNSDLGSLIVREMEVYATKAVDVATRTIDGTPDVGAIIYHKGTANPLFSVQRGARISGIGVYQPDQIKDFTGSPAPIQFQPVFSMDPANSGFDTTGFMTFEAVQLYGVWRGWHLNRADGVAGNIHIRNCNVCALSVGIELDQTADVVKVINNSFESSVWRATADNGGAAWMKKNSTACTIAGGVDGLYWCQNLITGLFNGVVINGPNGNSAWAVFRDSAIEAVHGIVVNSGGSLNIADVVGCKFVSYSATDSTVLGDAIFITQTQATAAGPSRINITGCDFREANGNHVRVEGDGVVHVNIVGGSMTYPCVWQSLPGRYGCVYLNNANADLRMTGVRCEVNSLTAGRGVYVLAGNFVSVIGNHFDTSYEAVRVTAASAGVINANTVYSVSQSLAVAIDPSLAGVFVTTWNQVPTGKDASAILTRPAFRASGNSGQTFDGTIADVTYATQEFDNTSSFDPTTGIFTAPKRGIYNFTFTFNTTGAGLVLNDVFMVMITNATTSIKNEVMYLVKATGIGAGSQVFTHLTLQQGNQVKVRIQRTNGAGTMTLQTSSDLVTFTGALLDSQ